METGSTESIKRLGIGLSMILAPLLLTMGMAIHPPSGSSGAERLAVVVATSGRWILAHILILVSLALLIPAMLGVMRLLQQRGAWFGLIGGALIGIGVVFFGLFIGLEALVPAAFASLPADQQAGLAPGMQATFEAKGALVMVYLGPLSVHSGFLVLAIGLFVARVVPRWLSATMGVGALFELVFTFMGTMIGVVGAALLLVGLGAIGLQVLKQSHQMEEATPA